MTDPNAAEAARKAAAAERRSRRGNIQGCGCLLILAAIGLGLTVVGQPLAVVLGFVGLIVLLVGLVS